ncbi:MAG: hypothetical protein NT077_02580 [Candidatus Taylorbacteria bacterium]|nr:hypothetical protein [Candidatus Taylorbacteria bacterium]
MQSSILSLLIPEANAAANNVVAFGNALNPIITHVVGPLVMLAFAIAVIVFVYGVIQMMLHETDAEAHQKGRMSMFGGLIGMFIMMSAWGIIYVISNTVKNF